MSTTILKGKQHQIENKQQQLSAIQSQLTISSTISNYGFRPWLKLMISKKVESSLADNHHTTKIKRSPNITFYNQICFIFRTVFSTWLEQARITRKEKENKADRFLLQKWLRLWAKVTYPGVELLFKSCA